MTKNVTIKNVIRQLPRETHTHNVYDRYVHTPQQAATASADVGMGARARARGRAGARARGRAGARARGRAGARVRGGARAYICSVLLRLFMISVKLFVFSIVSSVFNILCLGSGTISFKLASASFTILFKLFIIFANFSYYYI